jgi:hypothetical protein
MLFFQHMKLLLSSLSNPETVIRKSTFPYPIFVPQFGQNFGGLAGSGNGWPQFVQKAAAAACGFGLPQFGQNLPVFTLPQEHVHVSPLWIAGLAACC